MKNALYQKYQEVVVPAMMKEFGFKNSLQVPKISKVIINVGVGRFVKEPHFIDSVEKVLGRITGQKAVRTKAKKSISNFKIREGMEIGVMVTMRGVRMYEFLDKLLQATLPRVRDFHGISDKSFDRQGNYTLGFKEHVAFPEVKMDEIEKIHGLQVIINTTANTPMAGRSLLKYLGFPFKKN